jgi:predicted HAD superfamily phosphohydrolase YqeG
VVLQDLLGSHRLCLVLDLDHTLVNSAKFSEVDADWEYRLEQLAAEQVRVVEDYGSSIRGRGWSSSIGSYQVL